MTGTLKGEGSRELHYHISAYRGRSNGVGGGRGGLEGRGERR